MSAGSGPGNQGEKGDAVARLESTLYQLDAAGQNCKPTIAALIDIDSNDAWNALGRFLGSKQSAVVSFTLADLEEVIKPGAARALGASLSNQSVGIRRAALRGLARQEFGPSLVHLLRACRDPDAEVARAAKAIIVQRADGAPGRFEGVPELVMDGVLDFFDARRLFEMIGEAYPENVRSAAARRIGKIGDEEATQLLSRLLPTAEGRLAEACWEGLESCESVGYAELSPLVEDPKPETVIRALRLLARSTGPEAGEIFVKMSRDPRASVKAEAIVGLARTKGADAIEILSGALWDAEEVRLIAVDLLSDIPESTEKLIEAVDHRDPEIRKRVLTHLASRGVINDELMPRYFEFVEAGQSCSDQSDPKYMKSLAKIARVLGEGAHPKGLMALAKLARSTLRRLRRVAVEAITNYPPEVRCDALHDLADTYDREVLKQVAMGLWEAGDSRAMIPLIRSSKECRGAVAKRAKEHLKEIEKLKNTELLMGLLLQPFSSVRLFAAEKLVVIKDPRAVPVLVKASHDAEVDVQLAVFEALAPFAAKHADVTQRLLDAVTYGDVTVRQQACEALGEARCEEAVPLLVRALSNRFLRPRATEALKRIGDRMGILAIKRIERREKLFPKGPPSRTGTPKRKRKAI
ncbi:MAG: HEAT repeat domain-containing protein [Alphaproteobacteria bacterium]